MKRQLFFVLAVMLLYASCHKAEEILSSVETDVPENTITGFFLLNEGNMGSNKATIDYFDYETGVYTKNIYAERNPERPKELGDVGNDLQIYGNKLYAVINCSHFVEVMDVSSVKHITQISIPNCRYIVFKDGFAYVSSYAGPVQIDPNARLGYVAKIDTATLKVAGHCTVGYQPEEMVISGNKLYVANSGGYRVPNYDNTVSVIDLDRFEEVKKIKIANNLHRLEIDRNGLLYVSSRGDYYSEPSRTFIVNTKTDEVIQELAIPNSEMSLCGDSLYIYSTEWNYNTGKNTITYAIYDIVRQEVMTRNFITDGTEKEIRIPYGIAVNPENGDFYITDAKDYVTSGCLHCYSRDGIRKWSVITGNIPAHFAFTRKKLQPVK